MLEDLLLNTDTKKRLEAFVNQPSHGLLIVGPAGAGKKYLAHRLAAGLLDAQPDKIENHPYFFAISKPADKSEIPIESARQLINKLSLRVPGQPRAINRIAVIAEAELLSGEAQNALLKLLEEPPAGSLLILTSSWPQKILPTVISRLQKIELQPAELQQSLNYFEQHDPAEVESAWRLSRGASSLMAAILSQGVDHEMKQAVEEAKQIISLKGYKRLSYIQTVAKDKAKFSLVLEALSRVLAVLHETNVANQSAAKKILAARQTVLSIQESMEKNVNVRLLALNLALDMPL